LSGKIVEKVPLKPHCGTIAWGIVVHFDIIEPSGMICPNKSIGIIITCPEFYKNDFFGEGKTYQVVFSDTNQTSVG